MNAVMLAAIGRLPTYVDALIDAAGARLNFEHRTREGEELMEVAMASLDRATVVAVQRAYERFAPHIINSWPAPRT